MRTWKSEVTCWGLFSDFLFLFGCPDISFDQHTLPVPVGPLPVPAGPLPASSPLICQCVMFSQKHPENVPVMFPCRNFDDLVSLTRRLVAILLKYEQTHSNIFYYQKTVKHVSLKPFSCDSNWLKTLWISWRSLLKVPSEVWRYFSSASKTLQLAPRMKKHFSFFFFFFFFTFNVLVDHWTKNNF